MTARSTLKHWVTKSAVLLGLSSSILASNQWSLEPQESALVFVSIKKDSVAEVHYFRTVSGQLEADGAFSVQVDLTSVDTSIDIRNQRMRDFLFETDRFQSAEVSGTIDPAQLEGLEIGDSLTIDLPFTLSLHGVEKSLTATVQASKLKDNQLLVTSLEPVIINASDFELTRGVDKLRELASLPSIAMGVPVTFDLVFSGQ